MNNIDQAIDKIAAAKGERVEFHSTDPHKLARDIRARMLKDGITSGYSMAIEEFTVHVYKTKPRLYGGGMKWADLSKAYRAGERGAFTDTAASADEEADRYKRRGEGLT